jgi:hypothetical protein
VVMIISMEVVVITRISHQSPFNLLTLHLCAVSAIFLALSIISPSPTPCVSHHHHHFGGGGGVTPGGQVARLVCVWNEAAVLQVLGG